MNKIQIISPVKLVMAWLLFCSVFIFSGCEGGVSGSGQGSGSLDLTGSGSGVSGSGQGSGEISIDGKAAKGPFELDGIVEFSLIDLSGGAISDFWFVNTKGNTADFQTSIISYEHIIGLSATGKFFNEIEGVYTDFPIKLEAVSYLNLGDNNININLLTHITKKRILKIIADSDSDIPRGEIFEAAREQAQNEFLVSFSLLFSSDVDDNFERLSLFDDFGQQNGNNAYLLAATSLIYQHILLEGALPGESDDMAFKRQLTAICEDFADDGAFSANYIEELVAAVEVIDPVSVVENLDSLLVEESLQIANIDQVLDSDLDGVVNEIDEDDDNDGVPDVDDPAPHQNQSISLALGDSHSCALKNGEVTCWGSNSNQQLEIPDDLESVQSITAGDFHTCALDEQGVSCWGGSNLHGETTVPVLTQPTKISAGSSVSCALDSGEVICWGSHDSPTVSNPVDISAFGMYACVIDDNGPYCWDENSIPLIDVDILTVDEVAVGGEHYCVREGANVSCWGRNTESQLNVPAALTLPESVKAGAYNTCALQEGSVVCWGLDDDGESAVPTDMPAVKHFAVGSNHACATNGVFIECWGADDFGKATAPAEFQN